MTELFRMIGKNDIHFDAGATSNYLFTQDKPPRKLSTVLTRREALAVLPRLPLGVRPMALKHGLSVITMELNIHGTDDADMEAKEHDLIETLVETDLFFSNGGTMGTKAELQVKSDGASEVSFKSVFFAVLDELDARDVLGPKIKAHSMYGLRLTLYCEENWRPGTFNHLFNGGFEFWDGIAYGGPTTDTEPDGWEDIETGGIVGTNNREGVQRRSGSYSLKIQVTNSGGAGDDKGVSQLLLPRLIPGVTYTFIVWIQNAIITAGQVEAYVYGNNSGVRYARRSGAANPVFTRYTTTFVPSEHDTYLNAYIRITATGPNTSGIAYIDDVMVVRGTVVPDDFIEWHPNPGIRIGPNLLSNADFEEWHAGTVDSQPDCWIDFESLDGGIGTNNREATNVEQGCYALRVDVDALPNTKYKGVYQNILPRLTVDTEYVLIVWVKNAAITNGLVRVRVSGDGGGVHHFYALNSGAANDEYTRYVVTFTPIGTDTYLRIYAFLFSSPGVCSGTAYFDKFMVIEASVYNGHSFAPEEWTGCGYVYNHYDSDACHVNYMDFVDLKSDVDPPLYLKFESDVSAVYTLSMFRRTRDTPCSFIVEYEAEGHAGASNWADAVDATCSEGDKVSQAAGAVTGYIQIFETLPANLDAQRGWVRIYARLRTDSISTSQFRARVNFWSAGGPWLVSPWRRLNTNDTWELVYLGRFRFPAQDPPPGKFERYYIQIQYEKVDSDTVQCDLVLRMPDEESIMALVGAVHGGVVQGRYGVIDNTHAEFPYQYVAKWNASEEHEGCLNLRSELKFRPEIHNRIFMVWTYNLEDQYLILNDTDPPEIIAEFHYLPQYVSPLE